MEILKNTINLSKFLLSKTFRKEVLESNKTYVLCKNGKAIYVIHNLEAFKRLYDMADYGRRMLEIEEINSSNK